MVVRRGKDMDHGEDGWEQRLRHSMSWVTVVGVALFALSFFGSIVWVSRFGFWDEIAFRHFPAVIGLPSAALAAMFIVLILRTVAGAVEFKMLGIEFKGASGPIVMWMLCFLAISYAIRSLWDLKS